MKQINGCQNESCKAFHKIKYKHGEETCPDCGEPLVRICKDCYTPISDETKQYCALCEAEHSDRRDKIWDGVKRYGSVAATIVIGYFIGDKTGFDPKKIIKR